MALRSACCPRGRHAVRAARGAEPRCAPLILVRKECTLRGTERGLWCCILVCVAAPSVRPVSNRFLLHGSCRFRFSKP